MNIKTIIQHMENKSTALQAKMSVTKDRGALDIYEVFNREWAETQVSLYLLRKMDTDMEFYQAKEIKEKIISYLLEEVPDLAFYFKTESINKVLSDALAKAFERLIKEYFTDKIVNIVGEQ